MNVRSIPCYSTPYGRLTFEPEANVPGFSHRVAFRGRLTKHWLSHDSNPSKERAAFFVRMIMAEAAGLDKYFYADRKIDPPITNPNPNPT